MGYVASHFPLILVAFGFGTFVGAACAVAYLTKLMEHARDTVRRAEDEIVQANRIIARAQQMVRTRRLVYPVDLNDGGHAA